MPAEDVQELVKRLRKGAKCVYLAAEEGPANDLSDMLTKAADALDALRPEEPPPQEEERASQTMEELVASLRAQLTQQQELTHKAEQKALHLGQELAQKQCVQCAGRIDPEKLRCLECDERDAYLDAELEEVRAQLTEAQQARDKAESLLKQAHRDLTDPIGVVAQWQNEAETNRQAWLKERTRAEAAEATLASLRQLKPKHVCSSCDLDDEERAERKGWNAALKAVAALAGAGPTPPPRGADSMNHAVCSECTGHSGQHAQGCTKASPRNELTRDYLRGYATALIDAIAAIEYARDKGGPDDAARDGLTAAVFVIRHMRPPGPTPPQEPT
jgi:uncharacterized small protein (DUF1192 family)